MYGIVKCFPTSRRNSSIPIRPSQSWLSTTRAWVRPGLKSRNRSSWAWIDAVLAMTCSRLSRFRSDGPPGWIADHPGPAADDDDRAAAVALDVHEPEHRDEMPGVERRTARIEPVVGVDRPASGQAGIEAGRPILEETAPGELGQQAARIGRAGGRSRHRGRARGV